MVTLYNIGTVEYWQNINKLTVLVKIQYIQQFMAVFMCGNVMPVEGEQDISLFLTRFKFVEQNTTTQHISLYFLFMAGT